MMSYLDKIKNLPLVERAKTIADNQYVVGVIGILVVVYGSFMAPRLPPSVAAIFGNPVFKVLFIFLIMAVRNIHPVLSIILALGLIISIQTLNRYRIFTMAHEVSQITAVAGATGKKSSPEELAQLTAEVKEAKDAKEIYETHEKQSAPDPTFPINEDSQAIYDLNPPFVARYPSQIGQFARKQPTRYSAIHGYTQEAQPLYTEEKTSFEEPVVPPVRMEAIDRNLPNRVVTGKDKRLPMVFSEDPSLPAPPPPPSQAEFK